MYRITLKKIHKSIFILVVFFKAIIVNKLIVFALLYSLFFLTIEQVPVD